MDDVLAKTSITLLVVFAAAAATFTLLPLSLVFPAMIVGGLGAFVVSLLVVTRHKVHRLIDCICQGLGIFKRLSVIC